LTTALFQGVNRMRVSRTYQASLDEGRKNEARFTLLKQGTRRFGEPGSATRDALAAISELS